MSMYEPQCRSIHDLLTGGDPIRVPEYQRAYAWKRQHFSAFWNDLEHFSRDLPEVGGLERQYFLGSMVLIRDAKALTLLDGQQRLATACLLLSAIRDAISVHAPDVALKLHETYLCAKDPFDTAGSIQRLVLNDVDREFFRLEVMTLREADYKPQRPIGQSQMLLRSSRNYFDARLAEKIAGLEPGAATKRLLRIAEILTKCLSVIAVFTNDEDNAAEIFETLNDRGLSLSTADLLQNLILRFAHLSQRKETKDFWMQTVRLVSQKNTRPETFLRHYWTSREGEVKSQSLYRTIKENLEESHRDGHALVSEMLADARIYCNIRDGKSSDPELRQLYRDISTLSASALLPVALSTSALKPRQAKKILSGMISTYVRYSLVCEREGSVIDNLAFRVAKQIRTGQPSDISAAIAEMAALCPPDPDFKAAFAELSVKNAAKQRYLLAKLEGAKRGVTEFTLPPKTTVEHIYPQRPSFPRWRSHKRWIDRLGNLTLLSIPLRPNIKNGKIVNKAGEYGKSEMHLSRGLAETARWGTRSVRLRQAQMARSAVKIWPLPE